MGGHRMCVSVFSWTIVFLICVFASTKEGKNYDGVILDSSDSDDVELLKSNVKENIPNAERGFDITDEEMNRFKMWPGGIIPYFIDDLSFDKVFRDRLRMYLDEMSSLTGLQFNELPTPPANKKERYVFFINRRSVLECVDYTTHDFSLTGAQKIIVGYDCLSNSGNLAGTILGLAGVPPMHTAPDRGQYIEVQNANIDSGKSNKFNKLGDRDWLFHDLDYDFNSAGHFHWHQYSSNGKATIKPKEKYADVETTASKKLSPIDVQKIKMLYNYISKKKQKAESIPECNQLFAPGEKFDEYHSAPEDDLEPLHKPSKYTGIPDEPGKPDKSEKPDNNEKPDKSKNDDDKDNSEKPDNNEKPDKPKNDDDKVNSEKPDNNDKPHKPKDDNDDTNTKNKSNEKEKDEDNENKREKKDQGVGLGRFNRNDVYL